MDRDGRPGWLPSLGFAFLTLNCGMAVYRSWEGDDPSAFAFVVAAYVSLVLLFRCLHLLEVERRRRRRRDQDQHLKLGVWGLSTLLTLMLGGRYRAAVGAAAHLGHGDLHRPRGLLRLLPRTPWPRGGGGALTQPCYQPPARYRLQYHCVAY